MPTFTPPTMPQGLSNDHFFGRYSIPVGISVVKKNGVFERRPFPALREIADLEEGVEWFGGGRTYVIDDDTATALANDGFTVDVDLGYGIGPFGLGGYGY